MKTKILAVALFALTIATVVFYPVLESDGATAPPPIVAPTRPIEPVEPVLLARKPKVEVVFVLDTTGSMGGLIQAAKEKIWSIATTMASAQPAPEIRMGLVAYRDRGDAYVTQTLDLSKDLDSMYSTLMDFQAAGGGDGPESVNQALYDAVHGMSWSQDSDTYKVVFLVGDAPPHMDYQDDVKYPVTLAAAKSRGIVVNTIQSGDMPATSPQWTRIAQLGNGRFFQVGRTGNAVAVATPYDADLARLSAALDGTRMYYGTAETKEAMRKKTEAADKLHAKSSEESLARRAAFNTSGGFASNFLGDSELVDDVATGKVDLAELEADALPKPLQSLPVDEQQKLVEETAAKRSDLQQQIQDLARQRSLYIEEQLAESGDADDSLDNKIYSAVREQAAEVGLSYEDGPEY